MLRVETACAVSQKYRLWDLSTLWRSRSWEMTAQAENPSSMRPSTALLNACSLMYQEGDHALKYTSLHRLVNPVLGKADAGRTQISVHPELYSNTCFKTTNKRPKETRDKMRSGLLWDTVGWNALPESVSVMQRRLRRWAACTTQNEVPGLRCQPQQCEDTSPNRGKERGTRREWERQRNPKKWCRLTAGLKVKVI